MKMHPYLVLSIAVLALVCVLGWWMFSQIPETSIVRDHGQWPLYMLGGAVVFTLALAFGLFGLMFYSARHHDDKVAGEDDYAHWQDGDDGDDDGS